MSNSRVRDHTWGLSKHGGGAAICRKGGVDEDSFLKEVIEGTFEGQLGVIP